MDSGGAAKPLQLHRDAEPKRPRQILRKSENGEFELVHDALNDVLCHRSVGNKPIALISIVGAFRTGKSFLLNFILRYFENEGYKDRHWIGGDDEELVGFDWRGGVHPETEGVWMWSKPFIVEKDGKEVAVFLVDAQGHFDVKSGKAQSVIAVIVSMLFSSVTVFNISAKIGSADLEYIEQCIEFSERTNHGGLMCPLQAMIFLIRDWIDPEKYPYGEEGGRKYIDEEILHIGKPDTDGSLKRMRDKLHSTFNPVKCYLMPHPGLEAQKRSFRGKLSDLSNKDGFLEKLVEFCGRVANPNNLAVKKDMTAHKLMNLLIRNFDKMKSNAWELLESRSYEEIKQDNEASEKFYQVAGEIGRKLDEMLENGYIPPKEFKKRYQEILNELMAGFRNDIKFLGEKGVKRQEGRLRKYVDLRHFKRTQMANEVLKLANGNMAEVALKLIVIGQNDMEEGMKDVQPAKWDAELNTVYKKVLKTAEDALKKSSSVEFKEGKEYVTAGLNCVKGFMELEGSLKPGLADYNKKKEICDSANKKSENSTAKESSWESQVRFKQIRYDAKVYEFKKKILDDVKKYSQQTRALCYGKELVKVLKAKKARYAKEAIKLKREFLPEGTTFSLDEEVDRMLDTTFELLTKRDNTAEPFKDRLLELSLKTRKLLYLTTIGEYLDGGYASSEVLNGLHYNILEELLPAEDEEDSVLTNHRKTVKKALDKLMEEFKVWNEDNKSNFKRMIGKVSGGLGVGAIGASGGAAVGLFIADIAIVTTVGSAIATGVGAAIVAGVLIVGGAFLAYKFLRKKSRIEHIEEKKKQIEEGQSSETDGCGKDEERRSMDGTSEENDVVESNENTLNTTLTTDEDTTRSSDGVNLVTQTMPPTGDTQAEENTRDIREEERADLVEKSFVVDYFK